jgi:hypothetical protein
MAEEPARYQMLRSHADVHVFVVCYADRFYDDVPADVRKKGPWAGNRREDVTKLKPWSGRQSEAKDPPRPHA